jgi:hypothetical protein
MRSALLYIVVAVSMCFSALGASSPPTASENVWPVKVVIDLDARSHNSHLIWLREPGAPLSHMELRVTPDFNNDNEVAVWEVELLKFDVETGKPGDNLLEPKEGSIGLQPFGIIPADAEGHGYYPRRREISRSGFRCVIDVLGGTTKPSRAVSTLTVFESLRLEIELGVDQQKGDRIP